MLRIDLNHQALWRHIAARPPRAAGANYLEVAALLESIVAEALKPDFEAKLAKGR